MEGQEARPHMKVPDEMWITIFGWLTVEDLCSLSVVSSRFHSISTDDSLWKPLSCPLWLHERCPSTPPQRSKLKKRSRAGRMYI